MLNLGHTPMGNSPGGRRSPIPRTSQNRPTTVLVVEDFQPFRRLVLTMLEQRPEFRPVGEASDGLEAVQKARELQPDLILLDVGLPTLNGIEAARQMQELAPRSRILVLSLESSSAVVHEAFRLGAMGYVLKSHAGHELLPAIEAVLVGERFVSNSLKTEIGEVNHLSRTDPVAQLGPLARYETDLLEAAHR